MNYKNKTAECFAHTSAAKLKTRTHSRIHVHASQYFKKEKIPSPFVILQRLGIYPGKTNRKGYWILRCPFHKEGKEKSPSLNLHHVDGHFRCHACGAKGGDILDFYMRIKNLPFKAAAKELGAWEDFV